MQLNFSPSEVRKYAAKLDGIARKQREVANNLRRMTPPSMPPQARQYVSVQLTDIANDIGQVHAAIAGHRLELRGRADRIDGGRHDLPKLSRWTRFWLAAPVDEFVAVGDFFGVNVLHYAIEGEWGKAGKQAASFAFTAAGGHIFKGVGMGAKAAGGAASNAARVAGAAVVGGLPKALGKGVGAVAGGAAAVAKIAVGRVKWAGQKARGVGQRAAFQWYERRLGQMSVNTSKDRAMFYAGESPMFGPVWKSMEGTARLNNRAIINHTPAGSQLANWTLNGSSKISDEQAAVLWRDLSRRFAEEASGDVLVAGAHAPPWSVFRTVELPTLLKNPNVTTINGVPKLQWAGQQERLWAGKWPNRP